MLDGGRLNVYDFIGEKCLPLFKEVLILCIHTAGVASSKLALPTNILVINQALSGDARCFFYF